MNKEPQWFIEPLDEESNDRVGNLLAAMQMADDVIVGLMVKIHGIPTRVNVYRTPHKIIQYIDNSRRDSRLRIRIWARKGEHGEPYEWKFPKKKIGTPKKRK